MDGCMYGQPNYLASASRSTYLQHTLAKCTWKSIVFHITYIFFKCRKQKYHFIDCHKISFG